MSDAHLLVENAPATWDDHKLVDICDRVSEPVKPLPDGTRTYLGLEHFAKGFPELVGRGIESDVKSGKSAFKPNDVLFGKLRPYLRKAVKATFNGICSTDILVFRSVNENCPNYLTYLMHADPFIEHAKMTTTGVQHPRTSWPALREFQLTMPPNAEQQKIAYVLSAVSYTHLTLPTILLV